MVFFVKGRHGDLSGIASCCGARPQGGTCAVR